MAADQWVSCAPAGRLTISAATMTFIVITRRLNIESSPNPFSRAALSRVNARSASFIATPVGIPDRGHVEPAAPARGRHVGRAVLPGLGSRPMWAYSSPWKKSVR